MNARLEEPLKTFENGVVIKNEKLEEVLSGHQLEEFLEFANRYYQETAKAKNGLWFRKTLCWKGLTCILR